MEFLARLSAIGPLTIRFGRTRPHWSVTGVAKVSMFSIFQSVERARLRGSYYAYVCIYVCDIVWELRYIHVHVSKILGVNFGFQRREKG